VGEGGAERSEATGEGFVPQTPHHRPTAKRIPITQRRCAVSLSTLKQPCGDCSAIGGSRSSNFAGRSRFRVSFSISFALNSASSIEIDGSQHASSERDAAREAVLIAEGFRITRYWNNDVLQRPSAVLEDILAKLAEP
jgi:hypothetical protein